MIEPLTKRQREILDYIQMYITSHNVSPTLEEIKSQFNLRSISTIHEHLENLRRKGYLAKSMNQARGITNLSQKNKIQTVVIVGEFYNNKPLKLFDNPKELKYSKIMNDYEYFGIEIADTSLEDSGILKGDFLIIEKNDEPKNGDIIVCTIGNRKSIFIRKYYKEKYRVKLSALKNSIKDRHTKDINYIGKIVSLNRNF